MNKIIINNWWIIKIWLSAKIDSLVNNYLKWTPSCWEIRVETKIIIDLANQREESISLKSIKISFPSTSSPKDSIQQGTSHQWNSTCPKTYNKPHKNIKRQNHKDCITPLKKHHSSAISKNNRQTILINQTVEPNYTTVNLKQEMNLSEMHSPLKVQES